MGINAVIDTNVWISALLNPYGYPALLRASFEAGKFQAVISPPLLEELVDVLQRPRIKDKYRATWGRSSIYKLLGKLGMFAQSVHSVI